MRKLADRQIGTLGKAGEEAACRYLESKGFTIEGRNLVYGKHELDIVCSDSRWIVFCEVKTRTSADKRASRFGGAISSVTIEKQNNTVAAAREFIKTYSKRRFPRFDVIEVYFKKDESGKVESGNPERINHIPGAFRGTRKRY